MQSDNKFIDDLTKVASSAVSTMFNVKKEADALVKQNLERMLGNTNAISREEFEAIKELAIRARSEQEKLEQRISELENKIAIASIASARKAPEIKAKATASKKPRFAAKKPAKPKKKTRK